MEYSSTSIGKNNSTEKVLASEVVLEREVHFAARESINTIGKYFRTDFGIGY